MKLIKVWDLPTRLFHWILVLVLLTSVYTGLDGGFEEMDYHKLSGYTVLTLILFRLSWGFISKGNAGFSKFIVGPSKIRAYLKGGMKEESTGHNPLGGLSVIAMLSIILLQVISGLFSNDDIMIEGPLIHLISDDLSSQFTSIHHLNAWLLAGIVTLHLCAILYHKLVLKHELVKAMFTGNKMFGGNKLSDIDEELGNSNQVIQSLIALVLLALSGLLVYAIITYL